MNKWLIFIAIVILAVVIDMVRLRKGRAVTEVIPSIEQAAPVQSKTTPPLNTPSPKKITAAKADDGQPIAAPATQGEASSKGLIDQTISLTPNINAKTSTLQEYIKNHPEKHIEIGALEEQKIPANAIMMDASSKFPGEKTVPFSQLSTNCTDLQAIRFPVVLRVSGNGNVTEATPLFPLHSQADIPSSVLNCSVTGGGDEPFVTTYGLGVPTK